MVLCKRMLSSLHFAHKHMQTLSLQECLILSFRATGVQSDYS